MTLESLVRHNEHAFDRVFRIVFGVVPFGGSCLSSAKETRDVQTRFM
jgi:hypothetical protein